jgi:ElaB/YqjD/DUF883 family membrane-anchored ribosome-binding protein
MTKKKIVDPTIEQIKDDMAEDVAVIKAGTEALKDDTVEYLRRKADDGRVEAKIKSAELKTAISAKMDHLSDDTKEQIVRLENQVRMKPFQSIAAAFAAGAIISMLMKR